MKYVIKLSGYLIVFSPFIVPVLLVTAALWLGLRATFSVLEAFILSMGLLGIIAFAGSVAYEQRYLKPEMTNEELRQAINIDLHEAGLLKSYFLGILEFYPFGMALVMAVAHIALLFSPTAPLGKGPSLAALFMLVFFAFASSLLPQVRLEGKVDALGFLFAMLLILFPFLGLLYSFMV